MSFRSASLLATSALASSLVLMASQAQALPSGGTVAAGTATINTSGNTVTVNQSTSKAIINWQNFSATNGQTTRFVQPNAAAFTLNRDLSGARTNYDGALQANGRVLVVNPKGILFGSNAQVDVGGLVASTANVSDSNFMAGNFRFDQAGDATASVINRGRITAADGGVAALVGPGVVNSGSITARSGKILLGATNTYTLDFTGDGLINFAVGEQAGKTALDENGNDIGTAIFNQSVLDAWGGTVQMSANTARGIMDNAIAVHGVVSATAKGNKAGTILIESNAGRTIVGGKIDVSGKGAGEKGGLASLYSAFVNFMSGSQVDASGTAGGGTVNAGAKMVNGALTGSSGVEVGELATINASALNNGNGGTVNLLSNGSWMTMKGDVTAKGGAQGGKGGNANFSTFDLAFTKIDKPVDLSAPNGQAGTLAIQGLAARSSTAGGAGIGAAALAGTLNNGTNVSIEGPISLQMQDVVWKGSGSLKLKSDWVGLGVYGTSNQGLVSNGSGSITLEGNNLVTIYKNKVATNTGDITINTGELAITRDGVNTVGVRSNSGNINIAATGRGVSSGFATNSTPTQFGVIGSDTGNVNVKINAPILQQGANASHAMIYAVDAISGEGTGKKTLTLGDGSYFGHIVQKNGLTVRGENGAEKTKVVAGMQVRANDVTLSGLDISNTESGIVLSHSGANGSLTDSKLRDGALGLVFSGPNFKAAGNTFNVTGTAIAAYGVGNNTTYNFDISNNTINNATTGVHVQHAGGTIANNAFNGVKQVAVAVTGGNVAQSGGTQSSVNVQNNNVNGTAVGISVDATDNGTYKGNTIAGNTGNAIFLQNSKDNTVENNTVNSTAGTQGVGIVGYYTSNLNLKGNTVNNGQTGILTVGSSNVKVLNNTISGSKLTGILAVGDAARSNATITGNTVQDTKSGSGIAIYGMENSLVDSNRVSQVWGTGGIGGAGISIDAAAGTQLTNNLVGPTAGNGIEVINSSNAGVKRNALAGYGQLPIVVVNSPNTVVEENTF